VAHQGLRSLTLALLLSACGEGQPPVVSPTRPVHPPPAIVTFSEEPTALPKFISKRFHLTLPLPDGKAWKIDDHSRPLLVATHEATRSRVEAVVFAEPDLMSRQKCEERAREMKLVPAQELQTLEDVVKTFPDAFDTRLWVALEPGKSAEQPVLGHVLAFGGFLRKCLFFHFVTEVPSARYETVLSSRLAVARLRIFGGIDIESIAEVPRSRR
jgi:hypothetical protein